MRPRSVSLLAIVGVEAAAATMVALACSPARLPEPTFVQQPTSALVQVPYPPPPARPETLPAQPTPDAVWIDGEWVWQVRRYSWKAGRWIVPPAGASFSPWTATRGRDGTLYLAAGTWRDAQGVEVEEPATRITEPGEQPPEADAGFALPPTIPDAAAPDSTMEADASDNAEAGT
jgi:hypothetical protein